MKYFSDYYNDTVTKLHHELGAFYAFSNEQFEENKKPNVQYVRFNSGLLVPKGSAEEYVKKLPKIMEEAAKKDIEDNGALAIIRREFWNHETHICQNVHSMRESLEIHREVDPKGFSDDNFNKVVKECMKEALDKDLF